LIVLTFATEFDHMTPDVLQTFEFKRSKVRVTAYQQ